MLWAVVATASFVVSPWRGCSRVSDPRLEPRHCVVLASEDDSYTNCLKMKVSEIKAELDMRKISYDGLFEKEEYARLLADARATGRADPTILEDFNNKEAISSEWELDGAEPDFSAADDILAGDGSLPGGSDPKQLEKMMQNPELMALLREPKMQEVMKKVMEGGPDAAGSAMDDPEVREMLKKFQQLGGSM